MSKHHPTGLFRIKLSKWAREFIKTCKALGMTNAEIVAAVKKAQADTTQATVDPESNVELRQQDGE